MSKQKHKAQRDSVSRHAYDIWHEAGCPDEAELQHCEAAEAQLADGEAIAGDGSVLTVDLPGHAASGRTTPALWSFWEPPIPNSVAWHVEYREGTAEHVATYPTPEQAIEAACLWIDNGYDVHSIGMGPLSYSVDRVQIARIHAIGTRLNVPLKAWHSRVRRWHRDFGDKSFSTRPQNVS